jgi:hypothetical protein
MQIFAHHTILHTLSNRLAAVLVTLALLVIAGSIAIYAKVKNK